jgi:predicted Zn finger-like uncharacterized protein
MRIRCPSCSATYEVPDALLDPPRTVRCARCSHDWMASPVADDAVTEQYAVPADPPPEVPVPEPVVHVPQPEPAPVLVAPTAHAMEPPLGDTPLSALERLAAPVDLSPRIRRRDHLLTAAWAASFAALAALGVAGYTQRDRLMREWPASVRVYATLGLAPADMNSRDGKTATGERAP